MDDNISHRRRRSADSKINDDFDIDSKVILEVIIILYYRVK